MDGAQRVDAAQRVAEQLRERGAGGEIRAFPVPMPTAVAAADQLGCAVGAIANSLVFAVDGDPLMVVASGAHRVDTGLVAALLGVGKRKVRRASPEFVAEATGQQVGGVAPVGHPQPLRTLVDVQLKEHEVVWAGGGDTYTMFATDFDELLRLTDGLAAQVGD
ncbi:YbaK/EbsC family protein [Streptomyces smyrnaeus]|uniref:YbaK/EbsC family protein n=1 Tax=Streptomyces smyrnaeus TaxID=1387713 RepID=A0ABS3Y0C9_9ACTN|nr:YbaK/EbsC family protein [Streptomyces smyrnaeus]MBO8201108.1 YbaK/EbsC family protein [Streptomyces smyrnaeus]